MGLLSTMHNEHANEYQITVRVDPEKRVYVTEEDTAELTIDGTDSLCVVALITGWAMESRKPVSLVEFALILEQARIARLIKLDQDNNEKELQEMGYR